MNLPTAITVRTLTTHYSSCFQLFYHIPHPIYRQIDSPCQLYLHDARVFLYNSNYFFFCFRQDQWLSSCGLSGSLSGCLSGSLSCCLSGSFRGCLSGSFISLFSRCINGFPWNLSSSFSGSLSGSLSGSFISSPSGSFSGSLLICTLVKRIFLI